MAKYANQALTRKQSTYEPDEPEEIEEIEEIEEVEDEEAEDAAKSGDNPDLPEDSNAEEQANLLVLNAGSKDHTRLPVGKCKAKVMEVKAGWVLGPYGKYVRIEVILDILNPFTKKILPFRYFASQNSQRIFDFAAGILGEEPGPEFNLKSLEKRITYVFIEHQANDKGEIWDQIVETAYCEPKSKRAK